MRPQKMWRFYRFIMMITNAKKGREDSMQIVWKPVESEK